MIKIVTSSGEEVTLLATDNHGDLIDSSEFDLNDVRQKFPGLNGEVELQDRPGGRDLAIEVTLFAGTSAGMNASIIANNRQINELQGTLSMTGNLVGEWENITFKGFTKTAPGIRRDVAGNRFFCEGMLRFRQHRHS
jgi:hypothetical protein